ncbi:disease resistance protein Roq1-like isoform X3 [Quercus robur]|uniref:disease resistance protein Roq1-like isoform X3 n=1 Tax=Quercus robur TaxID=38942 RepID=UPI0021637ABB|nr:disease resistance protein Roq1-like isoform X3 [Quercus robur]
MDLGTGSTSSSFPSTTFGYTYDVFLSFRGEDTRNNFVGHLYTALDNKGIYTFKDDEKLQRGTIIESELFKAIEESRFAVVILSTDYASSSWCLIELAKIIECMEKTGITVLPVFHRVDPSDVRNLRGVFEKAFAEHSVRFEDKIDEVNNWRDALVKVANIAGWDLRHRSESPVIEEIVRKIHGQLNSIYSNVHEDCVGLDSRVTEIKNSYLGIGLEDVRFIGIWGMGGMGKTTLARVLHQRIHYHFDASSFIGNVREESCKNGLISLQKQLLDDILIESNIQIRDIPWGINMIKDRLCKKKVLITLDDVDQLEQLNALAGKRDWFGQGSRIIITTRDKHLLIRHGMTKAAIYNIKKLEKNEALKLFSREVFKKDYPPKYFMKMSQNVIHYADGLPLALKVLGANLMKREPVDWKDILDNLKEDPPSQLMGVFEISFNGLYSKQKNVFLDIACFFNGFNKDWVANILQTSIEIDVLVEKSLIEVSRFGNLWIHDTLQDFGREIVHRESPDERGQRSRLWLSDDIFHVLKHNTGTEKVKGIFLSSSFIEEKELHLNAKIFSKMINLRLLQIDHVHLPGGLDYLSNELCFMNWANYPLKSLPESFHPNKLIELIMHASSLKQLWKGIKSSKMLKHIDLSYSKDLIEIPDLTEVPNLEKLILKGCTSLSKIHTSLGYLEKLILLDMDGCVCLKSLPCKINSECLVIDLNGCLSLKNFPEIVGNMSHLPHLDLAGTAIEGLPLSIKLLTDLTLLSLRDCKSLRSLPDTICCLTSLTTLTLSGCSRLNKLPTNLGNLVCLENLGVIGSMTYLKELNLSGCSRLNKLPTNLGNLVCLENLGVIGIAISELPSSVEHLTHLTSLNLSGCKDLLSLPDTICSMTYLKELNLSGCSRLNKLPTNLGNLVCLENLGVIGIAISELPSSVEHLTHLTSLNLSGCKDLLSLPDTICSMTYLKELNLSGCSRLNKLPTNLGNLVCLENLGAIGIAISELPSSVEHLTRLTSLNLSGCKDPLSLLDTICSMTYLKELNLSGCSTLDRLPKNLGNLTGLKELDVNKTAIRELPSSLEHLSNLTSLNLSNCKELLSIPNAICNMTNIKTLTLFGCSKLEDLPKNIGNLIGLKKLEIIGTAVREPPSSIFLIKNLEVLCFSGCEGTSCEQSPNPVPWELPSLSCLSSLVKLELRDCNLRAIPNDIDSLHLLEKLNLSQNNFVCLPESIIRLSQLRDMYIENCTSLLSLPQIPLSTRSIWANGCTSLEAFPNELKQGNYFEPTIYLLNCFKLVDNQGFSDKLFGMLLHHFEDLCYDDVSGTNRYDLVVPGKKLPKWFSHQNEGDSVTLQVPPNFDEKCLAIGICAAFKHLPSGQGGLFDSGSHDRTRHKLFCSIALHPKSGSDRFRVYANSKRISFPFPKNFDPVESRHLWLIYVRREFLHKNKYCAYSNELHEIEEKKCDLQIKFHTEGTGLTFTNCGAHFVFKQDIEGLIRTNKMDFVSNGEGSFSDEPGHSGEGSSNVMTGTKRKWNRKRIGSLMLHSGNWFGNLWR